MPLYEYTCKKCKARLEFIQKFSDHPKKKCPRCGGSLEKVISPPALQFKGNGFYITDYAKKDKPVKEEKSTKKPKGEKANTPKQGSTPSSS